MADRINQIASHVGQPRLLLSGQVAIITGAAQGIGAETARLFAREGASVVAGDIDSAKLQTLVESINNSGGRALAVAGDITDLTYIDELVQKAVEFGHGEIHIIVNNAGYTWDAVVHKMSDKQWDAISHLHGKAPFRLVRAAAPYFRVKDGKQRNIVGISSSSGTHGNAGQANYGFVKAGVVGMMKTVAKEWGPAFNVRANAISFGYIETRLTQAKHKGAVAVGPGGEEIQLGVPSRNAGTGAEKATHENIPLRRPGTVTDAAKVILAVCSPLFSYVTGQVIEVTGGRDM